MRTYLLFIIVSCLAVNALAAPAPEAPAAAPASHDEMSVPEDELLPVREDACFDSARQAARGGKPDPAPCDVILQRAALQPTGLAAAHNNRGLILSAMGQIDEALVDFEAALQLTPGLTEARVNRANMLFHLARYPEALSAYEEVLPAMAGNRYLVLFNRALTYRALGDVDQAAADLETARRLAAAGPRRLNR